MKTLLNQHNNLYIYRCAPMWGKVHWIVVYNGVNYHHDTKRVAVECYQQLLDYCNKKAQ